MINGVLETAHAGDAAELIRVIRGVVTRENAESFVAKLRERAPSLEDVPAGTLATAISRVGDVFPSPETLLSFTTPLSQAAILVHDLLKRVSPERRLAIGKDIAEQGEPLAFTVSCVNWMRVTGDGNEEDRLFSAVDEREITDIAAARIRRAAAQGPLFVLLPKDAPTLLELWAFWGTREETSTYIRDTLSKDPSLVDPFLGAYQSIAWGGEHGLPFEDDMEQRDYERMARVVDPQVIFDALLAVYGEEQMKAPKYEGPKERPGTERRAHQFATLHLAHLNRDEEKRPGS